MQISYKLEPGMPVYTSEFVTWAETDEEPGAFTFHPPEGAEQVEMEPL